MALHARIRVPIESDATDGGTALAGRFGKTYGLLVATGSAALEVGLWHLGVRPGDDVLVPELTCLAVPASVLRIGANPLPTPVRSDMLMDPDALKAQVTAKTRAIVAVHHLGLPVDVQAIRVACPNLPVLEDASQAWGARYEAHGVGKLGDLCVASFGPRKPLTLGEAGGVFSDDAALMLLADSRSDWARSRENPPFPYALSPYAIPHIGGAIEQADRQLRHRRRWAGEVGRHLSLMGLPSWIPRESDPAWHRFPVWFPSVDARERALASAEGLGLPVQRVRPDRWWHLSMFGHLQRPALAATDVDTLPLLLRPDDHLAGPEEVAEWVRSAVSVGGGG